MKSWLNTLASRNTPAWTRQGSSIMLGRGGDAFLRFGVFLATARVLAPHDYSVYALLTAALATSQVVFSFGAPRTAMFLYARGHRGQLFTWLLAVAAAAAVVVGLGLWVFPALRRLLFPEVAPRLLLLGLAPLPFLLLCDSLAATLLSQRRDRLYLILLWGRTLGSAGVLATSLASSQRLEFLLVGRIAVNFAAVALVSLAIPVLPAWQGFARLARVAFGYALPVAEAGALASLHRRADVLLLSSLGRTNEIGAYAIAFALAETFWILSDSLEAALFVDLADRGEAAAQAEATRALRLYGWSGAAFLLVGLVGGEIAVALLFRSRYPEAAFLFPLALLAAVVWGVSRPLLSYLYSRGLGRLVVLGHGSGLAANVLLCLALIPRFGARGAVFASVASYSGELGLLALLFARRRRRLAASPAAEAS